MPDLIQTTDIPDALAAKAGTQLPALISAASRLFQRRAGRQLVGATYTETRDGKNRSRLFLKEPPITSVTSITINGQAVDNTQGNAWAFVPDTGELVLYDGNGPSRFERWFPSGVQNVQVVYVGGYSVVPDDIKQAVVQTVASVLEGQTFTGRVVMQKVSLGAIQWGQNAAQIVLPALAEAVADSYCLDAFG
jgi:hypothetical protein